jgi:hypothetical protein
MDAALVVASTTMIGENGKCGGNEPNAKLGLLAKEQLGG